MRREEGRGVREATQQQAVGSGWSPLVASRLVAADGSERGNSRE